MSWSRTDLPSFAGRTVVITGGNSGIGRHAASALARAGADVTIACRNVGAGEAVVAELGDQGAPGVRVAELDLADLSSVRRFVERWDGPLDVLVNNAGVMTPPRYRETVDGFELQFGTNHLGHVALTAGLLPHLLAAEHPRVTTVSSIAHWRGRPSVLDGNQGGTYQPERAYANSKLANLLFAFELQRRASLNDSALVSNAAHPGVSATNLVTSKQGLGAIPGVRPLARAVLRLLFQSAAAGADPVLYAVAKGGPASYSGPQRVRESRGPVGPARLSRYARDEILAAKLWDLSLDLTGARFDWS
jgi:NAD(P)-dependent dehydrogenase (short-subunit alcohol dehydrogenase family)